MSDAEFAKSYPVFYPVKKFYWTPDVINILLMILACIVIALPLNEHISMAFRVFLASLFGIHFVYRILTMYFKHEPLKGYIKGEIKLKPNEIIFEGKSYPVNTMAKLIFSFYDCEGNRTSSAMFKSINGQLSNGVKNSITISFKSGEELKLFFQRSKSDDIKVIKPLLVNYCKRDLINFHELTTMVCSSYKEVQELKAEYF